MKHETKLAIETMWQRWSRQWVRGGVCVAVLVAALATSGRAQDDAPKTVAKLASATAQMAHAQDCKRALRGVEGVERDRLRLAAVDAYRSVRTYFPGDAELCAEAAFRAGELLRAAGDLQRAQDEFEAARKHGAGTPWKLRAALELGHVARRAERGEQALAAYEGLIADGAASARQKDEASLWAGRVLLDQGKFDDARRHWSRVAEQAEDPLDRVRAWDWIALALVTKADLEGAAGVLERCRDALSEVAQEETKLGERVRTALSSMRAQDELAAAVAKRAQAKTDAPEAKGETKDGPRKEPVKDAPAKKQKKEKREREDEPQSASSGA